MARTQLFVDDERTYLRRLDANPGGFVVNSLRSPSPNYVVLHRASCPSMLRYTMIARQGGFTEHGYAKACATTTTELGGWTAEHGRLGGSLSAICPMCRPV